MSPASEQLLTERGLALLVRPMASDDLEEVQAIEERVHSHPWRPAHFADCLKAGNLALVAEPAENSHSTHRAIAAYAIAATGGGEADLLNVVVAPENQREGIASLLLDYLIAQIAESADNLFLEVRESNRAAITLYDNLGFNQVGVRANYYPAKKGREDALIFARSLK